jgi:hypothetical protein
VQQIECTSFKIVVSYKYFKQNLHGRDEAQRAALKAEHAIMIIKLDKESAEDVTAIENDDDDDGDDDEAVRKKIRPVKHLGLAFGKHSKTPAEVAAEHTTPQKRVRQKTTPVKRNMPDSYVSSDPSD